MPYLATNAWQIRIATPAPVEEVLGPVGIEYRLIADEPRGDEVAEFLTERARKIPYALFRKIVIQAADRCQQVEQFIPGGVLNLPHWNADGRSWASTIRPSPLGPVTVELFASKAWKAGESMEPLAAYTDEFATLDEARWYTSVPSWSDFWSWDPTHVSVVDGSLRIKTSYDPHERDGKTIPYRSGILRSKAAPQLYGYFEARIKAAPKHPGVCPAFWLYNDSPQWHTEIDIVELTQEASNPKIEWFASHVFILPGETEKDQRTFKQSKVAATDPRDDFHVYAVKWTKEAIFWLIDGQTVAAQQNTMHNQPLNVALSMGIRPPLTTSPSADGFPTEMEVDYVRVFF